MEKSATDVSQRAHHSNLNVGTATVSPPAANAGRVGLGPEIGSLSLLERVGAND